MPTAQMNIITANALIQRKYKFQKIDFDNSEISYAMLQKLKYFKWHILGKLNDS